MADPAHAELPSCLDEQAVLDLIAGHLAGDALARAEQHLATCDDCTELVARLAPAIQNAGGDGQAGPGDERSGAATEDRGPRAPAARPAPVAHSSTSLQAGTILRETYRIVRHIEKGGMGEVYEASHARLSGRYAVKVLPPEFAANKTMLLRFRREAQIASGLQHPNIVQVIDFHETDEGRPYLVMEYLDGENLAKLMARHGPFTLVEALPIVQQIASALGAVHRQGIVHRDIKPQNVFIIPQQDGARLVKLLDFGISKANAVSLVVTRQPALMGTPQYMAPEQALRQMENVGPATDQFALAAIVYEMLTGRPAFEGPLVSVVLYHIVHEPPPPMGAGDYFHRIEPILQRALAKLPGERFSSMAAFAAALASAATGTTMAAVDAARPSTSQPPSPTPVVEPPSVTPPAPRRRRTIVISAAAAIAIVAAALSFFLRRADAPVRQSAVTAAQTATPTAPVPPPTRPRSPAPVPTAIEPPPSPSPPSDRAAALVEGKSNTARPRAPRRTMTAPPRPSLNAPLPAPPPPAAAIPAPAPAPTTAPAAPQRRLVEEL